MLKGRFDFLQTKTPPLLGMDVSSSAVKLVELSDSRDGLRLERYVIEPLPKEAVADGNIANLDAVSDCAKRAWSRLETRIKNVAMALPAATVISKKILLPAGLREEEMEVQVETEANQYIPFPLDEVNLDFQVLGPAPNNPNEVAVLIAASRKDKVEDRVAVAEAAGLRAVVMDAESFATQTAFQLIEKQLPENSSKLPVAVFDIGSQVMNLNVLRDGQIIYSREQAFGGNLLTQQIQAQFNLAHEEAEVAKRNGGLPEQYQTEVLEPFKEVLALEVARALQFFFTSTQYTQVNHVVLAGGCAALSGLAEAVSSRAEAHAVIANVFSAMSYSPKLRQSSLSADAPALFIACGLAMRRFDPA
jgi:type IV pilus assembly protein PilM